MQKELNLCYFNHFIRLKDILSLLKQKHVGCRLSSSGGRNSHLLVKLVEFCNLMKVVIQKGQQMGKPISHQIYIWLSREMFLSVSFLICPSPRMRHYTDSAHTEIFNFRVMPVWTLCFFSFFLEDSRSYEASTHVRSGGWAHFYTNKWLHQMGLPRFSLFIIRSAYHQIHWEKKKKRKKIEILDFENDSFSYQYSHVKL